MLLIGRGHIGDVGLLFLGSVIAQIESGEFVLKQQVRRATDLSLCRDRYRAGVRPFCFAVAE